MSKMMRVDEQIYETLEQLSQDTGISKQKVLKEALDLLAREKFLESANKAYQAVRSNQKAWQREQKERAEWDATLEDGLTDD